MNEIELKKLINEKMILGSHSVNHELLPLLPFKKIKSEIDLSMDYLSQFTKYKTFCYPFGSKLSYNNRIKKYLDKKNASFSVTSANREITNHDIMKNRQELPRYNCNNFKYGMIE